MKRVLIPSLGALVIGLLLLGTGAGPAAAEGDCDLSVSPRMAAAGREFTISGSGFTPARLILQRDSGAPVSFDLDLGDTDPFEIPIASKPGDEGLWQATVVAEDGCQASVEFRVTLEPTDTLDDLIAAAPGSAPLAVYLLVVVGGFAAGTLIGRYARARA